jgi:hypothetical protein
MNIPCPKCGFESPESATECSRCGIVFGKWTPQAPHPKLPARIDVDDDTADGRLGPAEIRVLGIGLTLAIVVHAIPFMAFIFHPIDVLVHELGHAIAGWLFGYPSIPSFDFVYGGGITPHGAHQIAIALLVAGGFAYLGYLFRDNRRTVALIAAFFLVWLFIETSEWRRLLVIEAAGHASECIFAGIFLYMAIAGVGWRVPEVERPLGAFVAFFLEITMIRFCLDLMRDADFLEVYKQGKGGMLMHDVDAISADLTIHTAWHPSIQTLARLLLIFSFVPMGIALLLYFRRSQAQRVLTSFYAPQTDGPGGR